MIFSKRQTHRNDVGRDPVLDISIGSLILTIGSEVRHGQDINALGTTQRILSR